mmetsp:Transcript_13507/g.43137  ORF Transcript_13507/g.43137 Transcript_13507/m.43137 type:complete len:212 (-) Transcript_13507:742-1377(-)
MAQQRRCSLARFEHWWLLRANILPRSLQRRQCIHQLPHLLPPRIQMLHSIHGQHTAGVHRQEGARVEVLAPPRRHRPRHLVDVILHAIRVRPEPNHAAQTQTLARQRKRLGGLHIDGLAGLGEGERWPPRGLGELSLERVTHVRVQSHREGACQRIDHLRQVERAVWAIHHAGQPGGPLRPQRLQQRSRVVLVEPLAAQPQPRARMQRAKQ